MGIQKFVKSNFSRLDDNILNKVDNRLNSPGGFGSEVNAVYAAPGKYSPLLKRSRRAGRAVEVGLIALTGNAAAGTFNYSKHKGMNDDEAGANAIGLGMNYTRASGDYKARLAEEGNQKEFAKQKGLQAKFDAGQVAARIRRGRRADQPGTKGGTIKTSGLGSTGGQTTFAQLLGL